LARAPEDQICALTVGMQRFAVGVQNGGSARLNQEQG
jgi:hypothetical protein